MDPSLEVLLDGLYHQAAPSLWWADESSLPVLPRLAQSPCPPQLLSHRFDVVLAAKRAGLSTIFCDADFSQTQAAHQMWLRVNKEKALMHHLINQAVERLPPDGTLWLAGEKDEGIKTYAAKAEARFAQGEVTKHGKSYLAQLSRPEVTSAALDDNAYTQLRPSLSWQGAGTIPPLSLLSKPGIFGWQQLDNGSELLLSHWQAALTQYPKPAYRRLLDLGAGYGLLSFAACHVMAHCDMTTPEVTATDNNAAALAALEANRRHTGYAVEVVADDAGASLAPGYDLILCNPPFHQGFSVADDLTQHFLKAAHRLLSRQGEAWFVVNRFIPLEHKASGLFTQITKVADNGRFKVLLCTR